MQASFINKEFPRIGIVGGGQLGKMLCLEAKKMGLQVTVLDPTPKCPASTVSDEQIIAGFKDEEAIRKLAEKSDFITFEIELANSKVLKELQEKGCVVNPSPETLQVIQSKLRQKQFLEKNNLPVPKFFEVKTPQELKERLDEFGNHAMLKLSQDSYDGRGNFELNAESNLEEVFKKIEGKEAFIEEWIDFEKEISVMVARNSSGEIAAYPVSENILPLLCHKHKHYPIASSINIFRAYAIQFTHTIVSPIAPLQSGALLRCARYEIEKS